MRFHFFIATIVMAASTAADSTPERNPKRKRGLRCGRLRSSKCHLASNCAWNTATNSCDVDSNGSETEQDGADATANPTTIPTSVPENVLITTERFKGRTRVESKVRAYKKKEPTNFRDEEGREYEAKNIDLELRKDIIRLDNDAEDIASVICREGDTLKNGFTPSIVEISFSNAIYPLMARELFPENGVLIIDKEKFDGCEFRAHSQDATALPEGLTLADPYAYAIILGVADVAEDGSKVTIYGYPTGWFGMFEKYHYEAQLVDGNIFLDNSDRQLQENNLGELKESGVLDAQFQGNNSTGFPTCQGRVSRHDFTLPSHTFPDMLKDRLQDITAGICVGNTGSSLSAIKQDSPSWSFTNPIPCKCVNHFWNSGRTCVGYCGSHRKITIPKGLQLSSTLSIGFEIHGSLKIASKPGTDLPTGDAQIEFFKALRENGKWTAGDFFLLFPLTSVLGPLSMFNSWGTRELPAGPGIYLHPEIIVELTETANTASDFSVTARVDYTFGSAKIEFDVGTEKNHAGVVQYSRGEGPSALLQFTGGHENTLTVWLKPRVGLYTTYLFMDVSLLVGIAVDLKMQATGLPALPEGGSYIGDCTVPHYVEISNSKLILKDFKIGLGFSFGVSCPSWVLKLASCSFKKSFTFTPIGAGIIWEVPFPNDPALCVPGDKNEIFFSHEF